MRKIGKLALLLSFSFIVFTSCRNDEIESDIQLIESSEIQAKTTSCDINGLKVVSPSSTAVYTYTSNFTPNTVTWSVISGSITIISGQGTNTITLSFGSNFNGGTISAYGVGGVTCSKNYIIKKCTPPNEVEIIQDQDIGECPGDIFEFTADPNGSTDNGSYTWTVFQGASIISGQGTRTIRVQSPSSGGFLVRVTHVNDCMGTQINGANLAQFDYECDGGGLGGF